MWWMSLAMCSPGRSSRWRCWGWRWGWGQRPGENLPWCSENSFFLTLTAPFGRAFNDMCPLFWSQTIVINWSNFKLRSTIACFRFVSFRTSWSRGTRRTPQTILLIISGLWILPVAMACDVSWENGWINTKIFPQWASSVSLVLAMAPLVNFRICLLIKDFKWKNPLCKGGSLMFCWEQKSFQLKNSIIVHLYSQICFEETDNLLRLSTRLFKWFFLYYAACYQGRQDELKPMILAI